MRYGLFGGSFNPVTLGHIRLANYIIEHDYVDLVLLMPCYKSLYNKGLEDGVHRLNMIKLCDRNKQVQPFDWEIANKIEGIGTYDIMGMIYKHFDENRVNLMRMDDGSVGLFNGKTICNIGWHDFDGHSFHFIMGLDNSQKVRKWLNGDKILTDHKFIVVPRKGTEVADKWFENKPHIYLKDYIPDDISSSAAKKDILNSTGLLDPKVIQYIKENKLYGV